MSGLRCQSLCHRWEELAAADPHALAVKDAVTGRSWSRAQLTAAAAALPQPEPVLPLAARGVDFILGVLNGFRHGALLIPQDRAAALPDSLKRPEQLPPEIGLVKTTSGTTGQPRHVLCTAEQLAADAEQIVRTMGLRRDWPNVGVISMAHSYGFSNLVLPLLLHGIPLILADSPLPGAVALALKCTDRCTLPAVPAMWRAWHQAGILTQKIALGITAGAPMPVELEQAIHAACGVKVHNFYGSSECGGIAYDAAPEPRTDAAFAGQPMHGVSLNTDAEGRLIVRSPAVASGYLVPDDSLSGGTFRTADAAEIRPEGVWLLGRTGDAIHVAGRKIAPGDIESALLRLPGVEHCVVFGVPSADALRGDEIVAILNLAPGTDLTAIQHAARSTLPAGNIPRVWHSEPTLLPDTRGKISRTAWRQWWLGRR